jgi:hypothetical protein
MKFAIILASLCCGLVLVGCSDQSLVTDEDYRANKGPAAYSPDPATQVLPGYGR